MYMCNYLFIFTVNLNLVRYILKINIFQAGFQYQTYLTAKIQYFTLFVFVLCVDLVNNNNYEMYYLSLVFYETVKISLLFVC